MPISKRFKNLVAGGMALAASACSRFGTWEEIRKPTEEERLIIENTIANSAEIYAPLLGALVRHSHKELFGPEGSTMSGDKVADEIIKCANDMMEVYEEDRFRIGVNENVPGNKKDAVAHPTGTHEDIDLQDRVILDIDSLNYSMDELAGILFHEIGHLRGSGLTLHYGHAEVIFEDLEKHVHYTDFWKDIIENNDFSYLLDVQFLDPSVITEILNDAIVMQHINSANMSEDIWIEDFKNRVYPTIDRNSLSYFFGLTIDDISNAMRESAVFPAIFEFRKEIQMDRSREHPASELQSRRR